MGRVIKDYTTQTLRLSDPAKSANCTKWIHRWSKYAQSVFPLRFISRDFSNGYLVAEIFSHYYPQDFSAHSYDKGTSLSAKQRNWSQIERVRGGKRPKI